MRLGIAPWGTVSTAQFHFGYYAHFLFVYYRTPSRWRLEVEEELCLHFRITKHFLIILHVGLCVIIVLFKSVPVLSQTS